MPRPSLTNLLLLAATCAPLTACSSTIRWPRLEGPGSAAMQRNGAEQSDPYSLPDLGPEVVGGRPREFDKPRDEVRRSRQFLESVGARPAQMVPSQPIPIGPPVPVGPPIPVVQPGVVQPGLRY
jgi:hypothetical protein